MSLDTIHTAISNWNTYRQNASKANDYISQGNFFTISRELYETWKNADPENGEPAFIHAYLGVPDDGALTIYLVTDQADQAAPPTLEQITSCPWQSDVALHQSIPRFGDIDPTGQINILTGLERFFRWHLQKVRWFTDNAINEQGEHNIFQAFNIPFSDLTAIFNADINGVQNEEALVVIGLDNEHKAELILWGDTFQSIEMIADVSFPVPPFKPPHLQSNYKLLIAAGATP